MAPAASGAVTSSVTTLPTIAVKVASTARMVGKVGKVGEANKAGYIWSTKHGLAGVMNGQSIGELGLKANVLKRAVRHSMQRMGVGLAGKM